MVLPTPTTTHGSYLDYLVSCPELDAKHWAIQVEQDSLVKVHKPVMLSHNVVAVKAKQLPEEVPIGPLMPPQPLVVVVSSYGIEQQWSVWCKSAE
eukprot:3323605-Amphidinium_carterae.1